MAAETKGHGLHESSRFCLELVLHCRTFAKLLKDIFILLRVRRKWGIGAAKARPPAHGGRFRCDVDVAGTLFLFPTSSVAMENVLRT